MTLKSLYALIPATEGCIRCGGCCGHVPIKAEEIAAIGFDAPLHLEDCRYLTKDGCSCYENRPLMCRMFAASEDLPCPYGAKAVKPLSPDETREIVRLYDESFTETDRVT